ncbi:MAG: PEGA domain-containing protein [Polyangiaceae bacterium]|nr:PEGA domain-containing protein [Polyangiaceae bacterium]
MAHRIRSSFRSLAALALAGALTQVVVPAPARAQDAAAAKPDKKTIDAARKAYGEGEKAYGAGDYAAAYVGYKKAHELIPSPNALYWMAMSLDKQGDRPADALAAYEEFLKHPGHAKLGDDKVAAAKDRVAALQKTPGELTITTTPPGATVAVDGEAQPGETPLTIKVPGGSHKLTVKSSGFETKELEITVKPGGKSEEKVQLELAGAGDMGAEAPPAAVEPEPEPAVAPPAEGEPKEKSVERSLVPAYVTLGIAGAGAIVGTIFGLQAMSAKSKFDDSPTTKSADDVERNALIADISFGVALTLGITGVVLLLDDEDPQQDARRAPRLVVGPFASPTGGGAAARMSF